jgi:putative transposase
MSIETGGSAVKKVHLVEVGSVEAEAQRLALPDRVQLAMFEIAGSAKEGLLALAVGAGLAVLHECMEHEVDRVVGPKGRHDRERATKRHGHVGGEVTLGGRRVPISRPRVRSADDSAEVALASYAEFASRDLLEGSRWSGCSHASRRAAMVAPASRSAPRSRPRRGRRRSRRSRARS